MDQKYINIYNNLIKLTTNKILYKDFIKQDTFSDRLTYFLLHFAFFLKAYKDKNSKKTMQELYDFMFRQLEISIREIGYGDQSVNKKMKDYLNLFHDILIKIHDWEKNDSVKKGLILKNYLNIDVNYIDLTDYFDKYVINLSKSTLNYHLKGVINQ
jgi:cytochrome b pre-mRNA-processing protein 3